jgi:hypothetical protein
VGGGGPGYVPPDANVVPFLEAGLLEGYFEPQPGTPAG